MHQFRKKMGTAPTLIVTAVLAVALLGGVFMEPTTRLEPIGVGVALALFLICVRMIPEGRLSAFYRFTLWVFIFGTLLNIAYELWHSIYYTHFTIPGMAYRELVRMLFGSSVGDGFLAVINVFSVTILQRGRWPSGTAKGWSTTAIVVILALAIQIGIELGALATGRWAYDSTMPLVPILGVGLTPTLQMPLLMLPILSLAQRMLPPTPEVG